MPNKLLCALSAHGKISPILKTAVYPYLAPIPTELDPFVARRVVLGTKSCLTQLRRVTTTEIGHKQHGGVWVRHFL